MLHHKIGYVPRKQNKELSKILKTGWDKIFIAYVSDWQGCDEKRKFGAIYGQGDGLQGQSYAISTMEGLVNTARNINHFIDFASEHQELKFFVTPIGCGIAGYNPLQIAPLFRKALTLPNVYLPRIFWEYFWMVEGVGPDFFQPNKEWSRWDRL